MIGRILTSLISDVGCYTPNSEKGGFLTWDDGGGNMTGQIPVPTVGGRGDQGANTYGHTTIGGPAPPNCSALTEAGATNAKPDTRSSAAQRI